MPGVVVAVLAGLFVPTSSAQAVSYGAEYIQSWAGSSCPYGSYLYWTDDSINMFDSKMQSLGHSRLYKFSGPSVWASDITEDRDFHGADNLYGDAATMYVYAGHGLAQTNGSNVERFVSPFYSAGTLSTCWANSETMRLGEFPSDYYGAPYVGYAAYLMWLTCYSVNLRPYEQWDQTMSTGTDYIMGYRGLSTDSPETDEVASDWASRAMSASAYAFKSTWFWAIEDWYIDDTGELVANGNDSSDASYRLDNYKRWWPATHSDYHSWYAWSWYEG